MSFFIFFSCSLLEHLYLRSILLSCFETNYTTSKQTRFGFVQKNLQTSYECRQLWQIQHRRLFMVGQYRYAKTFSYCMLLLSAGRDCAELRKDVSKVFLIHKGSHNFTCKIESLFSHFVCTHWPFLCVWITLLYTVDKKWLYHIYVKPKENESMSNDKE